MSDDVQVTELSQRGSRAALSGVAFAVLFVVGWVLLQESPPLGASDDEVIDYFTDPDHRRASLIAGLYVVPFAAIAFIWFMSALRDRLLRAGGREHAMFSSVQLISGTLFVAALFGIGAAELAAVWVAESAAAGGTEVAAARGMIAYGTAVSQIMALRSGAVFVAVSTTRGMRAGLFPRWFGLIGLAMALALLLVATQWRPVVLSLPIWVVAASWLVLARRRNRAEPVEV